jgi:hypothetical protein
MLPNNCFAYTTLLTKQAKNATKNKVYIMRAYDMINKVQDDEVCM